MRTEDLRKRDVRHIWHPYTEMTEFESRDFPIIERAKGIYIYDTDGRALMDGIASWWCVNLGHSHPRLVEAIRSQAGKVQHVILGGMSHVKAIELSERLAEITPRGLDHMFYAGDGASAVEASLKIALQYWANVDQPRRKEFICLQDGYHGDTLGAIGVGYVDTFHHDFEEVVMKSHRACSPHCAQCPFSKTPDSCEIDCFQSMEDLIEEHHANTAAVIVEPLVQGAAGIRIYPEKYLKKLRKLCDKHGLLLIADEIAVGFGRTGKMFACEKAGIIPDIMTFGKGLTGGYLPMSCAAVKTEIYDQFRQKGDRVRTLFHGHTYCGNPITSAVALAALDVYKNEEVIEKVSDKARILNGKMRCFSDLLEGSMVLTKGMIGTVEINDAAGGVERAKAIGMRALELGLMIRPLGRAVYLWPPLVTPDDKLREMIDIFKQAIVDTGDVGEEVVTAEE